MNDANEESEWLKNLRGRITPEVTPFDVEERNGALRTKWLWNRRELHVEHRAGAFVVARVRLVHTMFLLLCITEERADVLAACEPGIHWRLAKTQLSYAADDLAKDSP
jgi:hypothetical protein